MFKDETGNVYGRLAVIESKGSKGGGLTLENAQRQALRDEINQLENNV